MPTTSTVKPLESPDEKRESRWSCLPTCGMEWNTFWTGGVCPGCGKHWLHTQCPECHQRSLHKDWYHFPDEVGESREVEHGLPVEA